MFMVLTKYIMNSYIFNFKIIRNQNTIKKQNKSFKENNVYKK